MRQRTFEIIRVPELEGTTFLFNNVKVRYVASCPETGISFYCSLTAQACGVKVYPDGRKALANATAVSLGYAYTHSKAVYLQFKNAFGNQKGILASHAVWMAAGRTIPPGKTIDHIDGCTTCNHISNLRCIDNDINNRDGGFLRKLRNKGIDPTGFKRNYLLRYFCRMAMFKATHTIWQYRRLSREQLLEILLEDDPRNELLLNY